jgi:hypothetical protein
MCIQNELNVTIRRISLIGFCALLREYERQIWKKGTFFRVPQHIVFQVIMSQDRLECLNVEGMPFSNRKAIVN